MKKIIIPLIFLLSACGHDNPPVIVTEQPRVNTPVVLPPRLVLKPVDIDVLNRAELQKLAKEPHPGDWSVFTLTPESFTNMTQNVEDIQRYIEQQRTLIVNLYRKLNGLDPLPTKTIPEPKKEVSPPK